MLTEIRDRQSETEQLAYQAHLLESVHDAIYATDQHHAITYWNRAAEQMYGWTAQEALGHKAHELLQMHLTKQQRDEFRRQVADIGRVQTELVQHRRDGTALQVEQTTIALKDTAGRVTGYVSASRDVTEWKRTVQALQESERRYRLLFENNVAGVFRSVLDLHSLESRRIECNDAYARIFGYPSASEMRNVPVLSLFTSEQEWHDYAERMIENRVLTNYEARMRHRDGRLIWILLNGRARDYDPDHILVEGTCLDITELKTATEALRASEKRFHLAVDNFPGIFIIYDAQRRIQFMNMPGIILTGRTEAQIIGHTDEELFLPDVTAPYLPSLIAAAETATVQTVEAQLKLPAGNFETKITYVPLLDDLGKPHQILGIAEDISERKHAEQALAQQAELLNLTHDGVIVRDLDGIVRFWNRGASEMYGWTPEEAIGRQVADLLHTDFPRPFDEIKDELLREGRWEGELVHTRRDGARIVISSRWAVQRDRAGNVMALLEIGNDITKRKRAEEALRMSEERYRRLNAELEARVAERTSEWESANQALLNEIQEHAQADQALRASEERFRLLAENAQDLIFRIRLAPTRQYEYVSPSATRVLGYTPEEFYADPNLAFKLVQPEERAMLEAVQRGEVPSETTIVLRWTRKDASTVWLEHRSVPVYDEANNLIAIESIARDVTERNRAEEALQLANQNLMTWASQLEQRNREISYLNEMGDLLQSCIAVEETYRVIENSARNLFPEDSGALYLLNDSKNLVEAVALFGNHDADAIEHVFVPDHCWALRRGRTHAVQDACSGLVCQHLGWVPGEGVPCPGYICVPMVAQGETLGVLYLRTASGDHLTVSKQRLAVSVAEHVALAISSLRLRETLRRQAIRDPLTGLFNRRYMEESLERELRRAARKNTPIAVVMLDLDNFKRFNDTFGHEAGDAILRTFGEFLGDHIREGDIACRYGGEEFTLILPEATLEETRIRMDQLRNAFKQVHAHSNGQSFGNLSVSLGIAIFPEHGLTAEALLRSADTALYRAKSEGRDRAVVATPE